MNKSEYENLKTYEQLEAYSQIMEGCVYLLSKSFEFDLFCWNDVYYKLTNKCPKTIQDLNDIVMFKDDVINGGELIQFLSSPNKYGFTELTVFETLQRIAEYFRDAREDA